MCHLLDWRNPAADRIFHRWELKLNDLFSISSAWFKDDLKKLLIAKMKKMLESIFHLVPVAKIADLTIT